MTKEDLEKMSTSELLELFYSTIKSRAEEILTQKSLDSLGGYDNDILTVFFSLKQGGYDD